MDASTSELYWQAAFSTSIAVFLIPQNLPHFIKGQVIYLNSECDSVTALKNNIVKVTIHDFQVQLKKVK